MQSNIQKLRDLHKIDEKILILENLLKEIETTPHLVFAKKPLRFGEYYEMINTTGTKTGGVIGIVDLPNDLGFKEFVIQGIKNEITRLYDIIEDKTIK